MNGQAEPQDQTSLWFRVEKEIADLLISKLESQQITPDRAAQIAKFVIQAIPKEITDEQMMALIPSLDDEFVELSELVNHHISEYELKYKPQVETEVHELIKQGNFQEASKLMNQYFQKKYNGQ